MISLITSPSARGAIPNRLGDCRLTDDADRNREIPVAGGVVVAIAICGDVRNIIAVAAIA